MIKIDLGCGTTMPEGYIGVDLSEESNATIFHDIKLGLPFANDYADEVRAHSVLEHFTETEFLRIMWEIWRVLKVGGIGNFLIPHGLSEKAVKDPTHRLMKSGHIWSYFKAGGMRQIQYSLPPFEIDTHERDNDLLITTLKKTALPTEQRIVVCPECGRKVILKK